jgi:antitoxin (DNA-binding transcriptional repressor) of toxin-antitoxin stability system
MNYITTTQLRTQTPPLIDAIMAGRTIKLIHRSQVVAMIVPFDNKPSRPFDSKKYLELTKHLKTPKLTQAQRDKNYREHMINKYGAHLS